MKVRKRVYLAGVPYRQAVAMRMLEERLVQLGCRIVNAAPTQHGYVNDIQAACQADLVIYIAPGECVTWALAAAAWAKGVPVWGLDPATSRPMLLETMVRKWFTGAEELYTQLDGMRRVK